MSLPANLDCERVVLGCVFTTEHVMDTLRPVVDPLDFTLEKHRRIWRGMCDLYDSGKPVDNVTVANWLNGRKELQSVEVSYLNSLDEGLPKIFNVEAPVEILKEKRALRDMLEAANSIMQRCLDASEKADAIREDFCALASGLKTGFDGAAKKPTSTQEMIRKYGPDELLRARREEGIRLPWHRLNKALSGLHPAQMVVLAAYTGRGKTSAALQIAVHATRQGIIPLIWTMEMDPKRLFRRIMNQLTEGNADAQATFQDRERTREAIAWVEQHPIFFDSTSRTVPSFCASIRQVQAQREIGLVVVDYLQLIRVAGRAESRTREVGENSRSLKLAAMDFDVPFLVLSQFRRPSDGKAGSIHDLKESGDIENDADVILLINSSEMSGEEDANVTVTIGKQREGPAGFDIPLVFRPRSQRFYSPEDL